MAKFDGFGFLEIVLHQGDFRVQFEVLFPMSEEMVKTKRALSKVPLHEGSVGSSCSSWNHPSPTEQNSFQDQLSQRRDSPQLSQQAAQSTLHTPLRGSATQLGVGGEGIQPGAVGSASGHQNHGQGCSPNRPEEFITSSRNGITHPAPSAPSLHSCSLDTFPWEILDSQAAAQEKRFQKVPPFASPPKVPPSKHGGVLKTSLNPSV